LPGSVAFAVVAAVECVDHGLVRSLVVLLIAVCAFAEAADASRCDSPEEYAYDQEAPIAVAGTTATLVFYQGWVERADHGLYVRVASTPRDIGPPQLVRSAPPCDINCDPSKLYAVAFGNGTFLVTWLDGFAVFGLRVGEDGVAVDAAPFEIARPVADASGWKDVLVGPPAVTWDGARFVVAWETMGGREVMVARVSLDGMATPAIEVSKFRGGFSPPAISCAAGRCLIAWSMLPGTGSDGSLDAIEAAFLDGTAVTSLGVLSAPGAKFSGSPAVAFDGQDYIVAWRGAGIFAARVTTAGAILDPGGVVLDERGRNPRAATDGTLTIVTWDRELVDGNGTTHAGVTDIIAQVIPAGGAIEASPAIVLGGGTVDTRPSLAFRDGRFLLVWERTGEGIFAGELLASLAAPASPIHVAKSEFYVEDCGCSVGGSPGVWLGVLALLLVVRRRRLTAGS
jgi:MYXO-CTERM domain-containing protein